MIVGQFKNVANREGVKDGGHRTSTEFRLGRVEAGAHHLFVNTLIEFGVGKVVRHR